MSKDTAIQASVKSRLLNISRENKENFNLTLLSYVSERFLYRLGESIYNKDFVLKGAYLLTVTLDRNRYRTTKDIDFLKIGAADADYLHTAIENIIAIPYLKDGVSFDPDSVILTDIKEAHRYQAKRAKVTSYIGNTKIVLQLDIGIGDTVTPTTSVLTIPALLDQEPPQIISYPIETIIAEKLEAIISIGLITSRMKDFYDLYFIFSSVPLNLDTVREAVYATFTRRQTAIPAGIPEVLSDTMAQNPHKQAQWKAFTRRIRSEHSGLSLERVLEQIRRLAVSVFAPRD